MLARDDAAQHRYAPAEQELQQALAIARSSYPAGHIAIAFAEVNLAAIYIDQGKFEAARPLLESAAPVVEAKSSAKDTHLAVVLYQQARMEAGLHEIEQADSHFRTSILDYEQATGPHDPGLGNILRSYAAFLKKVHRGSEAKSVETRARLILGFQEHSVHAL
jgi:Tfp pilus assembly protein PilF